MRLLCGVLALTLAPVVTTLEPSPAAARPRAGAAARVVLDAPVDGPLGRRYDAPRSAWGPGHRGVDVTAPAGAPVRAAAAGRVTFAGRVASVLAVTIDHGSGVETTYSDLGSVTVAAGDAVARGARIGTTGRAHPTVPGLHLGVLVRGRYADPERFLRRVAAVRLVPLEEAPRRGLAGAGRAVVAAVAAVARSLAAVDGSARVIERAPSAGGTGG